ncbi:MAG: glycoside hydrolase family 3 C-terminal domain-containing protein, partial [Terriglobus roseus]|nr:glycoside hydrolase family 3 C-terminal domain-containing protein [Terriglobus roseus]
RAPAIPRIGLPGYNWWNEGLHGLARDGYATVFPQAIGLAATWDRSLLHSVGEAVSTEARQHFARNAPGGSARYAGLTIWSPNINLFRDPRWGRGQETYGEDPVLTGSLAVQFVRGVQGDDPFYLRADATPKHFAVHSGPESGRDSFNAVVSPHDLYDSYFRAFRQVITEAKPAALMCSYNEINGVPSCASKANLQDLVRDRWGFTGYVVSDCDAVGNIHSYHHFAPDAASGAALALNAGVDLDCGSSYNALSTSVAKGLVSKQAIHDALHRLLLARVRLGMLDPQQCSPYSRPSRAVEDDNPAHAALALQAAEKSAVLLRNDGLLPLPRATRIAVIGPTADTIRVLEANYHGTARNPVTLLQGLTSAFRQVRYAQGSTLADGVTVPVPRTALYTTHGNGGVPGLHAEYFDQPSLDGVPAIRSVVPTVEFDLDRAGPSPAIQAKQFAARWTGDLRTPSAGDFVLRVNVDRCWDCSRHDAFRLYLDDRLVIDNDGSKGQPDRTTLHEARAASHTLRLEYMHTGQDEGVALEWLPPSEGLFTEAMDIAKNSDVVIAVVGLSPDLEGEALSLKLDGFDGGDRTRLALPAAQLNLMHRLQALKKPMVVVLTSGSAVALDEATQQSNAILAVWYPGQAGGTALAHLLLGEANPSGRLPVTFYRSEADLPPFSDYDMAGRTYRYFTRPVLYPFGYGLSYSRFRYTSPRLAATTVAPGTSVTGSVMVTNVS